MRQLVGPFSQILTMQHTPLMGCVNENDLTIIRNGGVLIKDNIIEQVGEYESLRNDDYEEIEINGAHVLMPGLIDAHTHMCFGGSRAGDYALRVAGKTYQEILKSGGGIYDTVEKTRKETLESLTDLLVHRSQRQLHDGITTCEVKSGYGLNVEYELRMLEAISSADKLVRQDLVPTCLAAHVCPKEYSDPSKYLNYIVEELFPVLKEKSITNRIDIFTEDGAFNKNLSLGYLESAREYGFDLTIHADQFTSGGSELAVHLKATSADHLEASTDADISRLAKSDVVCTVLPGASLGLGMHYAPARKLLDAGCCVAIATDWNPGSAPMGDLLIQTALIGASEKLSIPECIAGITLRAAKALNLFDRGKLQAGYLCDMIAFPTDDYQEIMYQQGKMKPNLIWKSGESVV